MYGYGYRYNSGLVLGSGGGGGGFTNTYSLDFDGVDDFVSCGDLSELGGQTEITISTWMKSTSSSNRILLDFKDGSSRITIQRASNSLMYLYVNNVNAQYSISTALNNWYNIVYVFDGSGATNSDKLKLYVNGIEIIASSFSGTVPTSIGAFTSAMDSKIASLYNGTFGFRGNIDEVSVFDSVIPIGDVWDGSGTPTDLSLLATPPINYYRFEEGMGTTAIDSGSGGNNGTLTNGVAYSTNVP